MHESVELISLFIYSWFRDSLKARRVTDFVINCFWNCQESEGTETKKYKLHDNFFYFNVFQFLAFKSIWHKGLVCKSSTVALLIRWYNKPGDTAKELWEKAIQFHETFHGLKITNCFETVAEAMQKQSSIRVLIHAKQLYWNHTSAWVYSWKFAAYFQKTF